MNVGKDIGESHGRSGRCRKGQEGEDDGDERKTKKFHNGVSAAFGTSVFGRKEGLCPLRMNIYVSFASVCSRVSIFLNLKCNSKICIWNCSFCPYIVKECGLPVEYTKVYSKNNSCSASASIPSKNGWCHGKVKTVNTNQTSSFDEVHLFFLF